MLQVIDPQGGLVSEDPGLDPALYQAMYRNMVLARELDRRMLALQRQGRIGTYALLEGHEAVQIGSAMALRPDDFVFPSYREHGVQITHGLPIEVLLAYWRGLPNSEWDLNRYRTGIVTVPIASQLPHAVGYSYYRRLHGDDTVTAVYFGDGATSEIDFHSGMNFAGVWKTPTVFICANNLYAISVPYHKQTASPTIAQKAEAYGFPGVRVDGNDVLAVYAVTKEALERARRGEGPTLIEAVTYRYGPHTTADDPIRYRPAEEVQEWQERRDPIVRFRRFLESRGLWSEQDEEAMQERLREQAAQVVHKAENWPKPEPTNMFDYMYAELPWNLKEQREALLQELAERGEAR